jgi:IS30 family transposase
MRHWYDFPELLDRTKLKELVDAGLSVRDLAHRLGCSRQPVVTALKRHGLAAKGQRGVMPRFIRRREE